MAVKRIPVYQAKISDDIDSGILAMSFVDVPAVERNFVALAKRAPLKLALNKQKQILTGVVLVPDQVIYRNTPEMGEYYMTFSAEDIERIGQKMMKTGLALTNTTHQHEVALSGNYLVELWTVSDPQKDKSIAVGLGVLPKGTLCASYKITDGDYWQNEVMTGNVKGFSLEGFFNLINKTVMSKAVKPAAKPAAKKGMAAFFASISALLEGTDSEAAAEDVAAVAADDETDSGTPYLVFELAEGGEVDVDKDGYATLNGEPVPAGQHALADGNFLVIDDEGKMVVTQPEADAEEPAAAAAALARQEAKDRATNYLATAAALAAKGKPDAKGKPGAKPVVKTALSGTAKKIADLEAQIALLKKTPSVTPAKPKEDAAPEKLSFTDNVAAALRARRERSGK